MRVALLLLALAVLGLPPIAAAQAVADCAGAEAQPRSRLWLPYARFSRLDPAAPAPDAQPVVAATASLSRHLMVGAGTGALTGAAFGLAVVALADCAGSKCTGERVAGVVGHAAAGAAVGALIGAAVHLIRR